MPKRSKVILLCLLACLCALTGVICTGVGSAFAESELAMDITQSYPEAAAYGQMITLGSEYYPDGYALLSTFGADIVPFADMRDDALVLELGGIIDSISVSYKQGGEIWTPVTEENSSNLPGDADYQFLFSYRNLHVSDLIASGGQMVYDGLPDWFKPEGIGAIVFGTTPVARIETVGGKVVITFDEEWLAANKDAVLNGTFKVEGKIDWRAVPEDGKSKPIPGIDMDLNFEDNLSQRYGVVDIEKSAPTLVAGANGEYYLKYEVTVTSRENVAIPDVYVLDRFMNGASAYIEEYAGVTGQDRELPSKEPGNYNPWETSGAQNASQGSLRTGDGGMYWTIGTLQPNEERVLTYYARIKEDYIAKLINNPIANQVDVYSGDKWKDLATSSFTPKNGIRLTKGEPDVKLDPNGNGTLTYALTLTAPADNSFTLKELKLSDAFPEELRSYFTNGQIDVEIKTTSSDGQEKTQTRRIEYADASFELSDLEIAPGEVVTVTYTVSVKNIFLASGGELELVNTASVSKNGGTLSSASSRYTLEKKTWMRKIAGKQLDAERTVTIPAGDDVYDNDGSRPTLPLQFTVPQDSVEYQVILNENGQWDLSSSSLKDALSDERMRYVGYVRIELFDRTAPEEPNDDDLMGELDNATAAKTVWVKIDDLSSFELEMESLGIPSGKYAYRLTYYARHTDIENVGSVAISNSFWVNGKVGIGKGVFVDFPGASISTGKIIRGGANYDAEKTAWYYEPYPVYMTEPMKDGRYPESWVGSTPGYEADYKNGAIYWVIRLEGTVGIGEVSGNGTPPGNSARLSKFYVSDTLYTNSTPDDAKQHFNRDAVVGIYAGPKEFDFTSYDSFEAFHAAYEDKATGLTQLRGNSRNDKWFVNDDYQESEVEYKWYASNEELNGIIFPNGYSLGNDRALYIVLRTALNTPVPVGDNVSRQYKNGLLIASGGAALPVNDAIYTYETSASLFKESKGAYVFDKAKGSFENCSDRQGGDWKPENTINKSALPSSGIYAAWLLNVNWDGTMRGDAYVSDNLPEGMELVYVDVNNFGGNIKNTPALWPQTLPIQVLNSDPAWLEMRQSCEISGQNVETITYYNKQERELRWHVDGLTTGQKDKHQINLRIICKVVDPELLLSQVRTYVNETSLLDPQTMERAETKSASVTIEYPIDKSIDIDQLKNLSALNVDSDGNIEWPLVVNRLPFEIKINPWGEVLFDGNPLPALIDELSSGIELIEDTLEISLTESGARYTDFTYDVSMTDRKQLLTLYGLPDGTPLTIKYCVRMTFEPNTATNISNEAYWAGHKGPGDAQVDISGAGYQPGGDVFLSDKISIEIIKADTNSHSRRLSGAVFELYEAGDNGEPDGQPLRTGTTDSAGKLFFEQNVKPSLEFDKVYCLVEVTPPPGYELNNPITGDRYYFMIASKGTTKADAAKKKYEGLGIELDIRYDGTQFSHEIVLENKKGILSVSKVFIDESGNGYIPDSGVYRFGLFDHAGQKIETLTIEYTEEGPLYFVGDDPMIQKSAPCFTKFDPEKVYQVYELDDNGDPVPDCDLVNHDGTYYLVSYSTEDVTVNSDIEVTNRRIDEVRPQSLALVKRALGQDAQKDRPFTFVIEVTGAPDGNYPIKGNPTEPTGNTIAFFGGRATVKLTHGQCIVINGLPAGASYSVQELDADGYDVVATNEQGTIDRNTGTKASYVNYRIQEDAGKTVDDEDGIAEIGQTLTYTIRWANNGMAANVVITDVLSDAFAFVSASNGGTLGRDGRTVTWELGEQPAYSSGSVTVTVTVSESAWDDKTILNDASIQIGDKQTVVSSEVTLATGELTVSKTVTGGGGDKSKAFTFTVTLGNARISGVYGDMTFRNGVAKFTLRHGESRTATGLPAGVEYTVTETDNDDYEVTMKGDAGWGVIEAGAARNVEFINHRAYAVDGVPATGDGSYIERWLALAIASASCMILIWRRRKAIG